MPDTTRTPSSEVTDKMSNNLVGYAALIANPSIGKFQTNFEEDFNYDQSRIGDIIALISFTNWLAWLILLMTSPYRQIDMVYANYTIDGDHFKLN